MVGKFVANRREQSSTRSGEPHLFRFDTWIVAIGAKRACDFRRCIRNHFMKIRMNTHSRPLSYSIQTRFRARVRSDDASTIKTEREHVISRLMSTHGARFTIAGKRFENVFDANIRATLFPACVAQGIRPILATMPTNIDPHGTHFGVPTQCKPPSAPSMHTGTN
jgi:hypothetical protein